jgi:GNAT superfamily N-acetyltransferase
MNRAVTTIRPASEKDVPAILGLIRELAEYEHLTQACIASEELLREHLFGAERAAEVLVAEVEGQAVAFALWFKSFSTFLGRPGIYLEDLYVRAAFRKRGIGRALLVALARMAVARNYGRVEWSVLDWNAPAIAFYKSKGAVALDDWTMMRLTGEALAKFGAEPGHAEA